MPVTCPDEHEGLEGHCRHPGEPHSPASGKDKPCFFVLNSGSEHHIRTSAYGSEYLRMLTCMHACSCTHA